MTRFDKTSPLWQNFKSLWLFFEGDYSVFGKISTLLGWKCFDASGLIYIVVHGQIILPSGHAAMMSDHCYLGSEIAALV